MEKVFIQWQDQFGHWKHLTSSHHPPSAMKSAQNRARNTGKRHRLVNNNGDLLDILEP